MKARTYLLTYLFALAIGILLLVFTGQTNLFSVLVIAIGILVILPSAAATVMAFVPTKDESGRKVSRPWYLALCGIAGLIFGILLVCNAGFWASYMVYTLGVILILAGLAQIVFFYLLGADTTGKFYFIMPWLTFIGGITVIIIGPRGVENVITIITGICLICYAANGFAAAIQRSSHFARQRKLARKGAEAPAD